MWPGMAEGAGEDGRSSRQGTLLGRDHGPPRRPLIPPLPRFRCVKPSGVTSGKQETLFMSRPIIQAFKTRPHEVPSLGL